MGTVVWEAGEMPPWAAEGSNTLSRTPGEHPDEGGLCVKSTRLLSLTQLGGHENTASAARRLTEAVSSISSSQWEAMTV